jgi:hypothetical protein
VHAIHFRVVKKDFLRAVRTVNKAKVITEGAHDALFQGQAAAIGFATTAATSASIVAIAAAAAVSAAPIVADSISAIAIASAVSATLIRRHLGGESLDTF